MQQKRINEEKGTFRIHVAELEPDGFVFVIFCWDQFNRIRKSVFSFVLTFLLQNAYNPSKEYSFFPELCILQE